MSKGIFIIGTGTDVGKTYVTGLLAKKIKDEGYRCGYYKAALSGAESLESSDAGYVQQFADLQQDPKTLVSYLYKYPVSPHLAAKIERHPVECGKIMEDYQNVLSACDYVLVEGSGGIVCPIRWDKEETLLLEEIIEKMGVPVLLVADAGLGTINATVLTVEYLKNRNIPILGIVMNRDGKGMLEDDNVKMIEALTKVPVLARVGVNDHEISIEISKLETTVD